MTKYIYFVTLYYIIFNSGGLYFFCLPIQYISFLDKLIKREIEQINKEEQIAHLKAQKINLSKITQ